jgi:hypothetical protein
MQTRNYLHMDVVFFDDGPCPVKAKIGTEMFHSMLNAMTVAAMWNKLAGSKQFRVAVRDGHFSIEKGRQ